ncbi:MAG: pseudouridine synthase [Candidatus Omnitrophica bacterium]|nr:pseudouridine synthase [Candidatus Omnitrophota bacterium]MDD5351971.1 pseudouridine synthase [Candidatus Omnitrophota bacterium]MDD5550797.1 pseudouridine synthase [Candidatus Omnitrophota bacterium]
MRLQVFLSHSGVCSRRKALELVMSGKVRVNNEIITEPSCQIDPAADIVCLNGKKIFLKEKIHILLNKPKGVTTTKKDPFAEITVIDLLPAQYKHLFPVGRLDKDSTGLLILTNDGDLSYKLTHPAFGIDKVYVAELDKALSEDHRNKLQKGVMLDSELTSLCKITKINERKIKIIIHEGRKRQIKRMLALFKYRVLDLERITLGNLNLGDLPRGQWRKISDNELLQLRKLIKENK